MRIEFLNTRIQTVSIFVLLATSSGCVTASPSLESDADGLSQDATEEEGSSAVRLNMPNSEEALVQRSSEIHLMYPESLSSVAVTGQAPPSPLPPPCPGDGKVGFSVVGTSHVSQGGSTLLGYNTAIITNVGGGWPDVLNSSTFTAPCTGLYSFSVSFTKDANYYGASTQDVWVTIKKNGASLGRGWGADGPRDTGAYTVTVLLNQGDSVFTVVDSNGNGAKRHLFEYNFTGFLVK